MSNAVPIFVTARDIHAFYTNANGPIMLCGVAVPSDAGIKAHSDGDVALHALCDAMLGLLAQPEARDIGSPALFPDTDPQWKDADSAQFVEHILAMLHKAQIQLSHVNIQIAAYRPKLLDYKEEMADNIARLLTLDLSAVNIQAMSGNGCDDVGKGLAIEALASVSALKPLP